MNNIYYIYTILKKNWKLILFLIVWAAIVIPAYMWLINHPECTTLVFENNQYNEYTGTEIKPNYRINFNEIIFDDEKLKILQIKNDYLLYKIIPPLCAYKIWQVFKIVRPIALITAIILFVILWWKYGNEIKKWFVMNWRNWRNQT